MRLFICHQSALEYWRGRRQLPKASANRRYKIDLPDEPASFTSLVFSGLYLPVHILLARPGNRRESILAIQHVFSLETPIGCFMNTGKRFVVSSPEFCFLQMAEQMDLVELIELGYELCGNYSLPLPNDKQKPKKGFYDRSSLTNTTKLGMFLKSMPGARGHRKAMRALQYLQDGSASPMETKLAMFLTLPYKLGGYGFSIPKLNHRILLSKTERKYFSKEYYVCDLFWPETKTAVEYDSDLFHTGSDRIANDSKRRNALTSIGVSVITVTKQQLYNSNELGRVSRVLSGYLGKRVRFEESSFSTAHQKLRKQLL